MQINFLGVMKTRRFLLSLSVVLALGVFSSFSFTRDNVSEPTNAASAPEGGDEYDNWTNSWSKPGHIYVHYDRGEKNDYDNFCLWLWDSYPNDLEGSLWAYSGNTRVSDKLTLKPMSTNWMTDAEVGGTGTAMHKDNFGVIADVDMNAANLVGGKTGEPTTLNEAEELGFLMVNQSSMDGSKNWTSDGGRETYVDVSDAKVWRTVDGGKCLHIFVATGALSNYTFFAGSGESMVKVNPIDSDTTGKFSSKTDRIVDSYGVSTTSEAFKELGVGYQVFVASFRDSNGDGIGDLRGVIDSIPYFKDLGVDVLWLTPIQQSDSYHGYDISDYYAVDKRYGTIDDYRELLYKCHKNGIKVLMDLVLNHTSKGNVWYQKSQWGVNSGEPGCESDNTGINWRNVYTWKFKTDNIQKAVTSYDDSAKKWKVDRYETITVEADANSSNPSWYKSGESDYYYYGKFGSGMPEINYESKDTRKLVINMAKYWLSFGLDGFRLDAVKHIYMKDEVDNTGDDAIITDVGEAETFDDEKGAYIKKKYDYSSDLTKNVAWWKEFSNELKDVYPSCFLVGENFDGWGTRTSSYYQALDSQFDFANYYHIPAWLYNGGTAGTYSSKQIGETFEPWGADTAFLSDGTGNIPGGKRPDFINGAFTSNHDVMRAINQANGIGNTNSTKASDSITGTAQEIGRAKVHAAITMLSRGISWIYYGDELGMSSNTNTHIAKYKSENCMDIWYRQPFLWEDASKRPDYKSGQYKFELDTYNKGMSDAHLGVTMNENSVSTNNDMYQWYKALCAIKHLYPKDARIDFATSSSNVLVINVWSNTDTTTKPLKIYINIGLDNNQYLLNPGSDFNPQAIYNLGYDGVYKPGNNMSNWYSVAVFQGK